MRWVGYLIMWVGWGPVLFIHLKFKKDQVIQEMWHYPVSHSVSISSCPGWFAYLVNSPYHEGLFLDASC